MISYVSLWVFLANSYCYQSPFSFLIIKCNRILTMDSHLHIRRRIFLCWHIWEFPRALLVWTWNLSSEILIRGGVHHFSRDLPCVPKQVMEKPRRRPSLAQTAMAGANNPPEIHFSLSLHKFSNYFFLEWISFNMMRLGRGSSLLRPLTEIQMQKKLQVRIRIISTRSLSFLPFWLRARGRLWLAGVSDTV